MKLVKLLGIAVLAIVVARSLPADVSSCSSGGCATEGCGTGACGANVACHPTIETEKIKKTCWDVEEDYVCIPKVRCPLFDFLSGRTKSSNWSATGCAEGCSTEGCTSEGCGGSACRQLSARVRKVRKAVKREVDCGEKCVATWEAKTSPASVGCAVEGGCTATPVRWSAPAPTATSSSIYVPQRLSTPEQAESLQTLRVPGT